MNPLIGMRRQWSVVWVLCVCLSCVCVCVSVVCVCCVCLSCVCVCVPTYEWVKWW